MDRSRRAVVTDPDAGRRNPAALLERLDADDDARRLEAAWAVCRVAAAHPETVEYFVARLADRVDGDGPPAVAGALGYLRAAYPDRFVEALPARSDDADRVGVVGGDEAPLAVHRQPAPDPGGVPRVLADEAQGDPPEAASPGEGREGPADPAGDEGATEPVGGRTDRRGVPLTVEAVADRSRFAALESVRPVEDARHTTAYRAIGRTEAGEETVVVELLRGFDAETAALADPLGAWADLDDEAVATLHDWGTTPEPWLVCGFSASTLAETLPLATDEALALAAALARGVARLHRRGVVHGGIDPRNVVVTEDPVVGDVAARLTNPGLAPALADDAPWAVLDPRYAPPEFYDGAYGGVDAASDVYGLGALTFALATGRHPLDGDAAAVREGVLAGDVPAPTAVDPSLPDGLDDVVATATAPRKLLRYGTVERLARLLAGLEA